MKKQEEKGQEKEFKDSVDDSEKEKKRIEEMKEDTKTIKQHIKVMKERRTEQDRPTIWLNKKTGRFEIHTKNKTYLGQIDNIDSETSREDSDRMADGSGYKQIIYLTDENYKDMETNFK